MLTKDHTLTIDGEAITITIPNRFPTQAVLEAYASDLNDNEFAVLVNVLASRRWTVKEFATRIVHLREDHPVWSTDRMAAVLELYAPVPA